MIKLTCDFPERLSKGGVSERKPDVENIGPYQLQGRLGEGGMGEVWLGHDARLGRSVAIKRLLPERQSPDARQRLLREARAVAALNHPAITQVHDIVEDAANDGEGHGDCIVMEHVAGHTVAQLLDERRLSGGQAIEVAIQVARGLAHAHERGLIHRDLKGANVMVTPEGNAKILDFGLAKPLSEGPGQQLTATGAVLGTVTAMSPEQALGEPVDARSDLFSLGVLLYEMFVGHSPFRRGNRLQSLQAVIRDPAPAAQAMRPELPLGLARLMGELLEKDPDQRPSDAARVADELERLRPEVAPLGPPPPPSGAHLSGDYASHLPTLPGPPSPSLTPTWPHSSPASASAPRSFDRRLTIAALVGAAAVAAALLVPRLGWNAETEQLRVLVLRPEITAGEPGELAATAVFDRTLATLGTLRGIEPVDPSTSRAADLTPDVAARAVAADEVLDLGLRCETDASCALSLRRKAPDAATLIDSRSREIFLQNYTALAEAVEDQVQKLYRAHPTRDGASSHDFAENDYISFLELLRRNHRGERLGPEDLNILIEITRGSPRLLSAYFLAISHARSVRQHSAVENLISNALSVEPDQPIILLEKIHYQVDIGELGQADQTLDQLKNRAPGSLAILAAEARILEAKGNGDEAAKLLEEILREQPTWQNYARLAGIYQRLGYLTRARDVLNRLQVEAGNTPWVLATVAVFESLAGNLERAEEVYSILIEIEPTRRDYTNLCWVQAVLRRLSEAEQHCRSALNLEQGDLLTRFNLGMILEGQGKEEEAHTEYREVLDRLDKSETRLLRPQVLMLRPLSLARLGDPEETRRLTKQLADKHPRNVQVMFEAAHVFAVLGLKQNAYTYAESALDLGLQPLWFDIPVFDELRSDPDFRALLSRYNRSV